MRLALVTETYVPEINGVTMTLSQLVAGLREKGHFVQVVRPVQRGEDREPSVGEQELIVHGIPIPNYPEVRFGVPCRNKLIWAWRRQKPDIIHVATEGPLGISAINAAKSLGIPCVSSFHTNFHSYSEHYGAAFMTPVVLAYLRHVHNKTLRTMAPTQDLVDELKIDGFLNASVLGRGVRLNVFNPSRRDEELRRQWGAGPNTTVVVHVSRLAAEKNYELLARTYAAIAVAVEDSVFVIAGDGPLRVKLRRQFPQAIFTGAISLDDREEMARIYASSDVFVYPSVTETFGNVVTEAMACGLAVVAYDYAAAAMHIKSGYNGIAVPLGDSESLLRESVRVANDPELQRKLGAGAVVTAASFDWTQVIDSFEDALLNCSVV